MCIKKLQNLTLISQKVGCLNCRDTGPQKKSSLNGKFIFEYSICVYAVLAYFFYLRYSINKGTADEMNNFLYWKHKRAPRKNNKRTTAFSNTNQLFVFAQQITIVTHIDFIDFALVGKQRFSRVLGLACVAAGKPFHCGLTEEKLDSALLWDWTAVLPWSGCDLCLWQGVSWHC